MFIVLALTWFVLNHFRREYYNLGIESGTGPYFAIIRAQGVLVWPIVCLFCLATVMLLFEIVHIVVSKSSK